MLAEPVETATPPFATSDAVWSWNKAPDVATWVQAPGTPGAPLVLNSV
jgi:hypothetical protein